MAIGKSQTLKVKITQANVTSMVAIFGLKSRNEVIESWAYPAKTGYSTMVKSGNDYSLTLSESATADAKSGYLVMDVKAWFSDGTTLVKRYNLINLADNYVAEIEE